MSEFKNAKLISNELFITLLDKNLCNKDYYLKPGLMCKATLTDIKVSLYSDKCYMLINFENIKISDESEPGPLSITLPEDKFNMFIFLENE